MSELFIEVCEGLHRCIPPEIIKASDLQSWTAAHESSSAGLFSSIFSYPTEDPYSGEVSSPFYLDFDNAEDPRKAQREAAGTIRKLMQEYDIHEASIAIAFSGMKGFSVTICPEVFNAEPSENLPQIWKSMCKELALGLKLKTLDLGIYDRRRLWRLLNSRHNKTGLYKVTLTLTELEKLTVDEIKELAGKPREPFINLDAVSSLKAEMLFHEHKEKVEIWISTRKNRFEASELKPQTEDPPCVRKLLESGAQKGNRNSLTFQLALYFANKGLAKDEIEKLCTQFSSKSDPPLEPKEIETLVDSAVKGIEEGRYSVGCSTFSDLCDKPNCLIFNAPEKPSWGEIGEPISFDEWQTTIQANFPALWTYAEACASTVAVLLIKDVQPLALVLQGAPSGGKTTTLDFFKHFPFSHSTDKFSPRAFVSHVAQKTEMELKKIDMLPRIKGKVLITADLTTLFGAKADDLKETFSILTRVLDGRGLTIDSGVHGSRGYEGDYHFVWIGATTPIPHNVWDLFGNLGARMYFMQIIHRAKSNEDYIAGLKNKNYRKKVDDCNDATLRFLKGIWREERVEWDSSNDSNELVDKLVQIAKLVTRLRGKINVVVKEGYGKPETFFSEPIIEEPERCIQAMYALARGHALLQGRRQISIDDLPVVLDVALSSAPWDRILAFAYVLSKEKVTAKDLEDNLRCSRSKALRTMETLKLLDLVNVTQTAIETYGGDQRGYVMTLKPEFKWFTSSDFKKLWRQQIEYTDRQAESGPAVQQPKIEPWDDAMEPRPVENGRA